MCTRKFVLGIALSIIVLLVVASVSAQDTNPRFGVWRNQSHPNNVMTYEPYGEGGMKITVATTRNGNTSEWSYVTLFDGEFRPVEGQENCRAVLNRPRAFNRSSGEEEGVCCSDPRSETILSGP